VCGVFCPASFGQSKQRKIQKVTIVTSGRVTIQHGRKRKQKITVLFDGVPGAETKTYVTKYPYKIVTDGAVDETGTNDDITFIVLSMQEFDARFPNLRSSYSGGKVAGFQYQEDAGRKFCANPVCPKEYQSGYRCLLHVPQNYCSCDPVLQQIEQPKKPKE
jgi:hypothetical protein